tara:strand:- start:4087 stop:4548 length:462 start_codon:yes stop_codon:yes gene_type:complete
MANTYKNISTKYLQVKEAFSSYTNKFIANSGSGIISAKKIRKINITAMWVDYIQKCLNSNSTDKYDKVDKLLDLMAIELGLIYKTKEKVQLEKSLSTASQFSNVSEPTALTDEQGIILTEGGAPLESEENASSGGTSDTSGMTPPSGGSGGGY